MQGEYNITNESFTQTTFNDKASSIHLNFLSLPQLPDPTCIRLFNQSAWNGWSTQLCQDAPNLARFGMWRVHVYHRVCFKKPQGMGSSKCCQSLTWIFSRYRKLLTYIQLFNPTTWKGLSTQLCRDCPELAHFGASPSLWFYEREKYFHRQ